MQEENRPAPEKDMASRARRLSQIVREVKVATAERDDVVVEMRDAHRARLELLAQELQPVIDEVPPEDDQFDFALSSGLEPRFWIDTVAHVQMGRDRRTYRFVRDTRMGRTVLAETADKDAAADAVARYVAERIVQRQRLLEGDYDSWREAQAGFHLPAAGDRAVAAAPAHGPGEEPRRRSRALLVGLVWFFSGCILGGLAMMAAFADRLAN